MSQAEANTVFARHPGKRKSSANPLQNGIRFFLSKWVFETLPNVPKRFTLYSPFLLLPVNFRDQPAEWSDTYRRLNNAEKTELFAAIAQAFAETGQPVTHIAISAPISAVDDCEDAFKENVLRNPSNLVPVYGDFGPPSLLKKSESIPSEHDFEAAFWASTKQSQNVSQVWAPRWTMFSRGNITEKNRILSHETSPNTFPGLVEEDLGGPVGHVDVVDLYIGIGYFAFSYLARGVKRVWGWDLNPWSIEGLRRGCEANGWRCLIVFIDDSGGFVNTSAHEVAERLKSSEPDSSSQIRCVAFRGDNKWAPPVMSAVSKHLAPRSTLSIRHVNLGLLPSSRNGWDSGLQLVDSSLGGWLHVHQNVDIDRINPESQCIVEVIRNLLARMRGGRWQAECQQIAQIKTYAPGVMHCVFDIRFQPAAD